jgi:hypothetical protein
MSARERVDFASNFSVKEGWTENDTELLEIIMEDGMTGFGVVAPGLC